MSVPAVPTPPLDRPFPRARIVGVEFDACDYAGVLDWMAVLPPDRGRYLCVSNVADVMTARQERLYAEALEAADLVVPDGMPVIWALKQEGFTSLKERVYGPTLMERCLRDARFPRKRHVLIAGQEKAREGVRAKFSDVHWAGETDFLFNDLDEGGYDRLADELNAMEGDFLWVSLGGGKQVYFMHRIAPRLKKGLLLGVGAAFDFHAGLIPQAPYWMQQAGLESVFRFCCEPKRLWRRYLVLNPPFFYHRWQERRKARG